MCETTKTATIGPFQVRPYEDRQYRSFNLNPRIPSFDAELIRNRNLYTDGTDYFFLQELRGNDGIDISSTLQNMGCPITVFGQSYDPPILAHIKQVWNYTYSNPMPGYFCTMTGRAMQETITKMLEHMEKTQADMSTFLFENMTFDYGCTDMIVKLNLVQNEDTRKTKYAVLSLTEPPKGVSEDERDKLRRGNMFTSFELFHGVGYNLFLPSNEANITEMIQKLEQNSGMKHVTVQQVAAHNNGY